MSIICPTDYIVGAAPNGAPCYARRSDIVGIVPTQTDEALTVLLLSTGSSIIMRGKPDSVFLELTKRVDN